MLLLSLIIFFIFLMLIFFLSKKIVNLAYSFFYRLTQRQNTSLNFLSFFLLIGTIIHELSHMLMAELLWVKTGEFSFRPQLDEKNNVRVGALQIAKTDPFRRTLIGLAPLIVGLTIIGLTFNLYILKQFSILTMKQWSNETIIQWVLLLVVSCLLSSVSLTMFSSRKDLDQLLIPAVILLLLALVFWLAGFRLTIPQSMTNFMDKIFIGLDKSLGFVIILNIICLVAFKGLNSLTSVLFRH